MKMEESVEKSTSLKKNNKEYLIDFLHRLQNATLDNRSPQARRGQDKQSTKASTSNTSLPEPEPQRDFHKIVIKKEEDEDDSLNEIENDKELLRTSGQKFRWARSYS